MSSLDDAAATERGLREQINDLVRAKARAESEAQRLDTRGTLAGADTATLAELADTYRRQSRMLGDQVEDLRRSLRQAEAELERLRAQQGGS